MSELERLVALLAASWLAANADDENWSEIAALADTVNTRAESARGYDKTRRGIDALERIEAKADERDIDYAKARADAAAEARVHV